MKTLFTDFECKIIYFLSDDKTEPQEKLNIFQKTHRHKSHSLSASYSTNYA